MVANAAAAGPPPAYVATAAAHVPLAVSAWCWGGRCGAPIAAARRTAVVHRGDTVRVELRFAPRRVTVSVRGVRLHATVHRQEITWRAARGGGITIRVTSARGWIAYVGQLRVR